MVHCVEKSISIQSKGEPKSVRLKVETRVTSENINLTEQILDDGSGVVILRAHLSLLYVLHGALLVRYSMR